MDPFPAVKAFCGAHTSKFSRCSPEILRRAKLNQEVATPHAWQTLYELLVYLIARSWSWSSSQASVSGRLPFEQDEVLAGLRDAPIRDFGAEPFCDADVRFVQYWLYKLGYPVRDIYTPWSVESCSSREALVALAWVMTAAGLITYAPGSDSVSDGVVSTNASPGSLPGSGVVSTEWEPPMPCSPAASSRTSTGPHSHSNARRAGAASLPGLIRAQGIVHHQFRALRSQLSTIERLQSRLLHLQVPPRSRRALSSGLNPPLPLDDLLLVFDKEMLAEYLDNHRTKLASMQSAVVHAERMSVFFQWVTHALYLKLEDEGRRRGEASGATRGGSSRDGNGGRGQRSPRSQRGCGYDGDTGDDGDDGEGPAGPPCLTPSSSPSHRLTALPVHVRLIHDSLNASMEQLGGHLHERQELVSTVRRLWQTARLHVPDEEFMRHAEEFRDLAATAKRGLPAFDDMFYSAAASTPVGPLSEESANLCADAALRSFMDPPPAVGPSSAQGAHQTGAGGGSSRLFPGDGDRSGGKGAGGGARILEKGTSGPRGIPDRSPRPPPGREGLHATAPRSKTVLANLATVLLPEGVAPVQERDSELPALSTRGMGHSPDRSATRKPDSAPAVASVPALAPSVPSGAREPGFVAARELESSRAAIATELQDLLSPFQAMGAFSVFGGCLDAHGTRPEEQ